MDDTERKKFYAAPVRPTDNPVDPVDPADDGDFELAPLDDDVTRAKDRQAKKELEAAAARINIDEIYSEAERDRGAEILNKWVRNFRFRFQVKHLLMGTAVLTIALTLANHGLLWPALIILLMLSIAGLYFYLKWEERKFQDEAAHKRDQLYAHRRAQLNRESGSQPAGTFEPPQPPASPSIPPLPNEVDQMWQDAMAKERFQFRFSMRELLLTMTVAALVMGMVRVLGGPSATATLLGIIALSGLIIHVLGYDPPQIVILGWWFTLVLYVLLSIFAAVWSSIA